MKNTFPAPPQAGFSFFVPLEWAIQVIAYNTLRAEHRSHFMSKDLFSMHFCIYEFYLPLLLLFTRKCGK